MQRSRTTLVHQNGKTYLVTELDIEPNLDHIETVAGSKDEFWMDWEIADTRQARPAQRRLFFALLHDIETEFVVPGSFLKELFYTQYWYYTAGKTISLSDSTESSVSDANQLLDLVVDFMFEWRVPFKKGYELLPRNERYFIYECCVHRECLICSHHADLHHVDAVGAGNNRNHIDHTQRHFMPLCRIHHDEIGRIGATAFAEKYHVPVNGIKLDVETLKKLGVRGDYRTGETSKKILLGE